MPHSHDAHIAALRQRVTEALAVLVPDGKPAELYDSARYCLTGGGKRIRPLLTLLSAEAFGVETDKALPAALALEIFHTFTLVHDDIMDHADSRRGTPTVHVVWGEDTAVLCGDYLLGMAYGQLSRLQSTRIGRVVQTFSDTVSRLCEGQALDKIFEERRDVSVADYLDMVDRKTGALLQAALEIGGLAGSADDEDLLALRRVGRELGRAFQIRDDLLDLVAKDTRWGKRIGGDLVEGKKTLLLLETLRIADDDERAWFARIVEGNGLPPEDIPEARERMERLGVLEMARAAIDRHSDAAVKELVALPGTVALEQLIRGMQARAH